MIFLLSVNNAQANYSGGLVSDNPKEVYYFSDSTLDYMDTDIKFLFRQMGISLVVINLKDAANYKDMNKKGYMYLHESQVKFNREVLIVTKKKHGKTNATVWAYSAKYTNTSYTPKFSYYKPMLKAFIIDYMDTNKLK